MIYIIYHLIIGSYYKNGPGKYEFGNRSFEHLFDPAAIIQRIEIADGEMKYNSRFVRSRNYVENSAEDRIKYIEIGTWAEDWSVTHDDEGKLIEDEVEVGKVRSHTRSRNYSLSLLSAQM